ncbi:MAG: sulfatase-like hydrolase/transferase [Methylotenera sp.]|nr:sulfatase-like hydrolase/transferase [Methylotenera sp.]
MAAKPNELSDLFKLKRPYLPWHFWLWHLVLPLLAGALLAFAYPQTGLDKLLIAPFYDGQRLSFPLKNHAGLEAVMHQGLKYLMVAISLLALSLWALGLKSTLKRASNNHFARLSAWLETQHQPLLWLFVGMLLTTGAVALLKHSSIHDCPWNLLEYGGTQPYIALFASLPVGVQAGHCFPGGHASGGFALFALYFAFRDSHPRLAKWGWLMALLFGGIMGYTQMMRGAHFMSHNLWTAWLVWMLLLLQYLIWPPQAKRPAAKPALEPSPKPKSSQPLLRNTWPLLGLLVVSALSIWLCLRLLLWLSVSWGLGYNPLSLGEGLAMLGLGLWFDLNALCYALLPLLLLSLLLPNRVRQHAGARQARRLLAGLFIFLLLFTAVAEFVFWQEFSTRFNFIAVDYLIYTKEVIGNIRQSYPVPWLLFGIALLASGLLWAASKKIRLANGMRTAKQKFVVLLCAIGLPLLSAQLANVDQMEFSRNAYANELAGNGWFSFAAAARRNELDYDTFYKTLDDAEARQILQALHAERQPVGGRASQQAMPSHPFSRRPKNVVLISVESLSADYLGVYGNRQNLTPQLDALAADSVQFDRVFATGTRTVRGLDALSIGIPPIPGQAVVHRPNSDHLAGIGQLLRARDYATYFIYGGYGAFDNMNRYFASNDYTVVDRTDFDEKTVQSENIWGVDDESLFINATRILDAQFKTQQPFFAHIMTTSNHRPYTFPVGKIDLAPGSREAAVKYSDYAIGQFIALAKTKPWFKDTLFVIVADHCAAVAGKTKLPVAKYHIPLFFYAPALLPARHYTRVASQIDIVPTLLDALGEPDAAYFYGQSLFQAEREAWPERAFISNYQSLGYLKNGTLTVLTPKRRVEAYQVDAKTLDSTPVMPSQSLLEEAVAYYQTASRAYKSGALKIVPRKEQ